MSLAIYKYKLQPHVTLPKGAEILHCDVQNDQWQLWAIVDTDPKSLTETRHFQVLGTGHKFESSDRQLMKYISTFQQGMYVWHVFEWLGLP